MAPQTGPLAGFGPNEWLVQELYESWLHDPATVDQAWSDFFSDYTRRRDLPNGRQTDSVRSSRGSDDDHGRSPDGRRTAGTGTGHHHPDAPSAEKTQTAAPSEPSPPAGGGDQGRHYPRPVTRLPRGHMRHPSRPGRRDGSAARCHRPGRHQHGVQSRGADAPGGGAVPAKLLVDNRIVINNHLARCAAARCRSPT